MLPQYQEIELSKLHLDKYNPRIPKSLQGKEEKEILQYMLLDASLIELMLAIGVNDFFKGEQLLVVKQNDEDTYKVVEGNRRLSAVKLLNDPQLTTVQQSKIEKVLAETTFRPTQIPCLVFNEEKQIHDYLGYKHITGIKEWKLLEKARYLYELKKSTHSDQPFKSAAREIAKKIGSRTDYVNRILVGYEIYQFIEEDNFFNIRGLNDTTFFFNYIIDSINKSNIASFLGVDVDSAAPMERFDKTNLKKWTLWLFEKNSQNKTRLIGDSYDLAALNAIIGNPQALEAFEIKGATLAEAEELTNIIDEQFVNYIQASLRNLEKADRLVVRLKDNSINIEEELRNIRSTANKILKTLPEKNEDL
jgi:hypothetical protein